ncbi:hypothetical protein HN859_00455 [Candidatus Parcubacteria bacterium]|jgi:hypothetical protein|nr:hypothetical protein [Candidatus Parcubacteria bacterium]
MDIVIDFTPLLNLGNEGTWPAFWYLFSHGGWVIILYIIGWGAYDIWLMGQQIKWYGTNKFVLLAVDVPKDTEQTPKAVEQLFATVSGAHAMLNAKEMYMWGQFQLHFSFEIVSIDGYVQFLIWTPTHYRDLIESSIYSQYPDAEITEVEDYVQNAPYTFPNETHKIWGTEVIPVTNQAIPIKTYTHFEDPSAEERFKDPLASMLETMSKIQPGEQVWFQILVKPTGFDWVKKSMELAYKIAGKKTPPKKGNFITSTFGSIFGLFFLSTGEPFILPGDGTGGAASANKKDDMPSMMLHLTPGEKGLIEAIELKASKLAFECKIRLIYIAPIEVYSPARVISSVFGSIKQFAALDLNSFKPDPRTKTKINYFFIKQREKIRRENLMKGYRDRSGARGHNFFILGIEELATLWHFPSKFIRAPLLQRTESKKAEPPSSLPFATGPMDEQRDISDALRGQLNAATEKIQINTDNKVYEETHVKKDPETVSTNVPKSSPPPNLPT